MPVITTEQVLALAPDTSSAQAGRKLAAPKYWKSLGQDAAGLWGECQGSALYQVKVDLSTLGVACNCPSRKSPCKHGIGLLLLAASDAVPTTVPPDWMIAWIAKRAAKAAPKPAPAAPADLTATDRATTKRTEKRQRLMTAGLDGLDLWLSDLMRNGLGGLEAKGGAFWEAQAARMVDAQVPGVASRLRRMAGIPGSSTDWPERLMGELGKLALLARAWRGFDDFEPALRETVRQQLGWSLSAEEVDARGELVSDRWAVLGQWVDDGERIRVQRTWLRGQTSGRAAVFMQYAPSFTPFADFYLPGSVLTTDLRFWPGAYPLRARVANAPGVESLSGRIGGHARLAALLRAYAEGLARDPWLDRMGAVLLDVTPTLTTEGDWLVLDNDGDALPFSARDHWRLLAVSGGYPVDLMAEWNGETLLPLGVIAAETYTPITEARA